LDIEDQISMEFNKIKLDFNQSPDKYCSILLCDFQKLIFESSIKTPFLNFFDSRCGVVVPDSAGTFGNTDGIGLWNIHWLHVLVSPSSSPRKQFSPAHSLLFFLSAVKFVYFLFYQGDLSTLRFFFLLCGGLTGIFGSKALGFSGAGALGALTAAFVAGHKWRCHGWNTERVRFFVSVLPRK
jgi:hypothetical protein